METGKQNKNLILSFFRPEVHQYQQTEPSIPNSWKVLIVLTPIVLVTADLILGGGRSLQSRYLLSSLLFVQISVAYFLTKCIIFSFYAWEKVFWRFAYLTMVFVGVISAITIAKTPGWDYLEQGRTANALNLKMAPLINVANRPVVISEATHSFVLGLSQFGQ
ncbi:hypothetical protein [Okeania sp. SIO1H5]|nr:hypothetical protein [Okeania sp. SIO1H5]